MTILESEGMLWAVLIGGILIISFFAFRLSKREIQVEEPEDERPIRAPHPELKPPKPKKITENVGPAFVEEKEITTKTTKIRKIPLILKLPESCPKCSSPFKGKSGDTCEYCDSVVRAKRVKAG